MNNIGQGLTLSGIGILITFSALGLLILMIWLLKKLFPPDQSGQESSASREKHPPSDGERQRKIAAVSAAALIMREKREQNLNLGKVLETPPGEWWKRALDRIQSKE